MEPGGLQHSYGIHLINQYQNISYGVSISEGCGDSFNFIKETVPRSCKDIKGGLNYATILFFYRNLYFALGEGRCGKRNQESGLDHALIQEISKRWAPGCVKMR